MSDVSALLLIEMQNGLPNASQPPYQKARLLANVTTLIHAARSAQAAVYFAQHTGRKIRRLRQTAWHGNWRQTIAVLINVDPAAF